MDPLEAYEGVDRTIDLGRLQIGFHHLVSSDLTVVCNGDGGRDRVSRRNRSARELDPPVLKRGVAQSVSETPKRLARAIAIGTVLERIVSKRRQVARTGVEGNRQSTSWIVGTRQSARDRSSAIHARVPCLNNRYRMFLGPGQCECAAAQRHHDHRLASCPER